MPRESTFALVRLPGHTVALPGDGVLSVDPDGPSDATLADFAGGAWPGPSRVLCVRTSSGERGLRVPAAQLQLVEAVAEAVPRYLEPIARAGHWCAVLQTPEGDSPHALVLDLDRLFDA